MIYTTHLWEFWGWFIIGFTTVYIYLLLTKWNLVNINGMGQLWGIRIIDWLIFEGTHPETAKGATAQIPHIISVYLDYGETKH